jgi:uncharacterized lipoprotein YmbA
MRRSQTAGAAFLGAALLAAAGCLGRSPEVRLYTLDGVPGEQVGSPAGPIALIVGPIRLPQYLDRPEIARRRGSGRIEFDGLDRWAGGLEANVIRALTTDLAQRLSSQRVAGYPGTPAFPVEARVRVDFSELVADGDGRVRLEAVWSIEPEARGADPIVESVVFRSEGRGGSIDSIVGAHDEVIGRLADAIAARLPAALVSPEPTAASP